MKEINNWLLQELTEPHKEKLVGICSNLFHLFIYLFCELTKVVF